MGYGFVQARIFESELPLPRRHEIRRALIHIESNFIRSIPLEELAAVAQLSLFRFIKLFNREIGLPPHRYQSFVRVRLAQKLMFEGVSLAQVANEVGFCDQSHLNRHFKAFYGVTPGVYLRGGRGRR